MATAGLALPFAAWVVEGMAAEAENWIFPLQLTLVIITAGAFSLLASRSGHRGRTPAFALATAVGATVVADAIWFLAIAG